MIVLLAVAALAASPSDLTERAELEEALWREGHFVAKTEEEKRERFDRLVEVAEEGATIARGRPGAIDQEFWAAVAWGEWASVHAMPMSAFRRVPARIRDHAERVLALDPDYRDGAGARLLGKLYADVPRVPGLSGWADREEGIRLLRRAYAISRRDPRNALFLAEALLEHEPGSRAEAIALLREAAACVPRDDHRDEDDETIAAARARLSKEAP